MLSEYFKIITKTNNFKESLNNLILDLQGKRVLLYGAGEAYIELNKRFKINEKLNIIGIADKKFCDDSITTFKGLKAINPDNLKKDDFDVVLVTNEYAKPIVKYLKCEHKIDDNCIRTIFVQDINDESINLTHLYSHKFNKTLPKLIKKLRNKTVMLYGAGCYLEVIKKYFDLSGLNIVGIADKKYKKGDNEQDFLGYKCYSADEIKEIKPDYVVISTKNYVNIVEDLYNNSLRGSGIRIKPLVKKSFWALYKEISK